MNVENHFIRSIADNSPFIGDDGALIDNMVYSKDIFFENVHFKRKWLTPYQIGYKAMMVNLSDAIAMNAEPKFALLGVAMPKTMSLYEMDELSRGLREGAQKYGAQIIGGDTISNQKLDISVTIVSKTKAPLFRRGLKLNDVIAHTGTLGESSRHLRYLMAGGKVHTKSRFVSPTLRWDFIRKNRRYLRCGMDISDGLFSDVEKLSRANRMDIRWLKKPCKKIGCSGEEYEMLIAFSPRQRLSVQRRSKLSRTPLNIVGIAKRGKYTNRCKAHHF